MGLASGACGSASLYQSVIDWCPSTNRTKSEEEEEEVNDFLCLIQMFVGEVRCSTYITLQTGSR